MRKRTIIVFTLLIIALGNAFGQIIYTKEDEGNHLRLESPEGTFGVMVPLQNVDYDQWKLEMVPVGDGLMVLLGLGGAYLLKKKRSKK